MVRAFENVRALHIQRNKITDVEEATVVDPLQPASPVVEIIVLFPEKPFQFLERLIHFAVELRQHELQRTTDLVKCFGGTMQSCFKTFEISAQLTALL